MSDTSTTRSGSEFIPVLTEDRREAITARRFACEVHDTPGECTIECAHLIAGMSGDSGIDWYDETGCSYPAPKQHLGYDFDADTKACIEVTYTPVECLDDATYDRLFA